MKSADGIPACVHVTGALSGAGMGVARAVWETAAAQHEVSAGRYAVHLLGLNDPDWNGEPPVPTSVPRTAVAYSPFLNLGLSRALGPELSRLTEGPAVIHAHGMWMYQNWKSAWTARERELPLIVSPHGMMCPWSFRSSGFKKRPVFSLIEKPNLRRAACLLAASDKEAADIEAFDLGVPVATIPFGVSLNDFPSPAAPEPEEIALARAELFRRFPALDGPRLVLLLGRLHPVKAPEHLLGAMIRLWCSGAAEGSHLVFAGPDDSMTRAGLEREARRHGLEGRVTFTGAVFGPAKLALLRQSSLLVLCSHDENFGYVVPEALACGTPALATDNLPWGMLSRRNAGWNAPFGIEGLAARLETILALSDSELRETGMRGRAVVESEMSWDSVARRMLDLYDWARNPESPIPPFVRGGGISENSL